MKVLILQGSPNRDGSTAMLADEFARGARQAGMTRASRHLREAFELGASL